MPLKGSENLGADDWQVVTVLEAYLSSFLTSTIWLMHWIESKWNAQPGFPAHLSPPIQNVKLKSFLLWLPQPLSGIFIMFYHPSDWAQKDGETEYKDLQICI